MKSLASFFTGRSLLVPLSKRERLENAAHLPVIEWFDKGDTVHAPDKAICSVNWSILECN